MKKCKELFLIVMTIVLLEGTCLFAQTPGSSAQIDSIIARLKSLEDQNAKLSRLSMPSDEQKAYVQNLDNERAALNTLLTDSRSISLAVASKEVALSSQYFQIFLSLGVIAGIIGSLAGVIMERTIRNKVIRRAQKYIDKEVSETVSKSSLLSIAINYSQLSYTWWQHYETEYQRVVRGGHSNRDILPDIRLAKSLAEKGLEQVKEAEFDLDKNERAWSVNARLKNNLAYSLTTEIVLMRKLGLPLNGEVEYAIKTAAECERLALDKKIRGKDQYWFNFKETAASCYVRIGSHPWQDHGRGILRDLFNSITPGKGFDAPPPDWLKLLYEEYFPVSASEGVDTRIDMYGLGVIKTPELS